MSLFFYVLIVTLSCPQFAFGSPDKPSLMMAQLEPIDTAPSEADILSYALLNSLMRTNVFQAVECRDLKELLSEMSLSMSDIMNQDRSKLKPGLIKTAQVACLGTVGKNEWAPVTNKDFSVFVDAGGYKNPSYWSEDGYLYITRNAVTRPRYWTNPNLNQPSQPLTGISFYEAEAYCNWADRRFPLSKNVFAEGYSG